MAFKLAVPTLAGQHVRLEPLTLKHVAQLHEAATEGSSTFGYTDVPHDVEAMLARVQAQLRDFDAGLAVPFVQVNLRTDRAVGMTRFLTIRSRPSDGVLYAVEIGGTWLAPSAQRTGVNTEAKLLLLAYAFDTWNVIRVDMKTDDRNERAKVAIEGLGATFEGVLRHWQPSQVAGEEFGFRNTAMFSIIAEEWSGVSARLTQMLAMFATT